MIRFSPSGLFSRPVAESKQNALVRKPALAQLYQDIEENRAEKIKALNKSWKSSHSRRFKFLIHSLLFLFEGGLISVDGFSAAFMVENKPKDSKASLWDYYHQRQDNNLTCGYMFGNDPQQACDLSFDGAVAELCSGTLDNPTEYSAFIKACTDVLHDCCLEKRMSGLTVAVVMATIFLVVSLVMHLLYYRCMKITPLPFDADSFDKNQMTVLKNLTFALDNEEEEGGDELLCMMKKLEPLIEVERAYNAHNGINMGRGVALPPGVLGEIHRFYHNSPARENTEEHKAEVTLAEVDDDGLETPLLPVAAGPT